MVRANDGGIDHLQAVRYGSALAQSLEHQLPDASQRPAAELAIDPRPGTEIVVKITPQNASTCDPEHAIQHPSVIRGRPASLAAARHHEGLEKRPLLVRHQPANQDRLPNASLESRFDRLGKPLRQQDLEPACARKLRPLRFRLTAPPGECLSMRCGAALKLRTTTLRVSLVRCRRSVHGRTRGRHG